MFNVLCTDSVNFKCIAISCVKIWLYPSLFYDQSAFIKKLNLKSVFLWLKIVAYLYIKKHAYPERNNPVKLTKKLFSKKAIKTLYFTEECCF